MPAQLSNDFILVLIDKGLIPDDTISMEFKFRWGNVPIMTIERMPDGKLVEYFIDLVGHADELVPLPPEPEVVKPPAVERRGF